MAVGTELVLMDFFLKLMQKAQRDGLLTLEDTITFFEKHKDFHVFDLTYTGLRLIVEGWDYTDVQRVFDNYRKQYSSINDIDFEIVTQSCLSIQRGDGCIRLILYYAGLLPEKVRNSESFLKLAEKYGYCLKYETGAENEAKRKAKSPENQDC